MSRLEHDKKVVRDHVETVEKAEDWYQESVDRPVCSSSSLVVFSINSWSSVWNKWVSSQVLTSAITKSQIRQIVAYFMSGIKGGIKRCFLKSEGLTINSTIDITLYIITGAQFCLTTRGGWSMHIILSESTIFKISRRDWSDLANWGSQTRSVSSPLLSQSLPTVLQDLPWNHFLHFNA